VPQLGTSIPTITRWLTRYQTDGIKGFLNEICITGIACNAMKTPIKNYTTQHLVDANNMGSLFFASRNSPLLQNIFPGTGGEN